jgi:2-oxo-4-hydroxy-4-carboxy-5-ureidoimidazoline decarboxylase
MSVHGADPQPGGPLTLAALNALDEESFVARLGEVFEHSPWIAQAAYAARPFASVAALHGAMLAALHAAGPERERALLAAHPELARPGPLTPASAAEQASLGLDMLEAVEAERWASLNAQYRQRFGFPFIIAVRGQRDRAAILAALGRRLEHDPEDEERTALAEVAKIARFRLEALIADAAGGRLTVHVLDTAAGRPAAGLGLSLFRLGEDLGRRLLGTWRTNADGRCDEPLLAGEALSAGMYEILFAVGAWRAATGDPGGGFYDEVPIRFRVRDPGANHHVPLILAPFGYSTYRGS